MGYQCGAPVDPTGMRRAGLWGQLCILRFPACISRCCQQRWGGRACAELLSPHPQSRSSSLTRGALVLHVAPVSVPVCVKPRWEKGCGPQRGTEAFHHPGAPSARCGPGSRGAEPPHSCPGAAGSDRPQPPGSPRQLLPLLTDKCNWISKLHQLGLDSISLFSSQTTL